MAITQRGQLVRDDSFFPAGYNSSYITGTGATIVKGSAGFLHTITFNKPVATSVVSLCDDATVTSGTFGIITVPSSPQPVTLVYDKAFSNGLVINVATAASDITVTYV